MSSTDLVVWGLVVHLVCDWLLQNRWMADNKANTRHPAGYVHSAIHTIGLCFVFPLQVALCIGIVHWLIDLRFLLERWRKIYGQGPMDAPIGLHIAIWGDQVLHVLVLAVAALWCAR